ncbi:hypothetical protein ABPG74_004485 [Tetrahymena malaccensis]
MQSEQKYNTQVMKSLVSNFSQSRQQMQEKKNVLDNMDKMKKTFDQIGSMMSGQLNYIKNFNSQANNKGDGEDKHLELKRYCEKFLDIMKQELIDLLGVIKINFNPQKKDVKADLSWEKMQFSIENEIESVRNSLNQSTNYFEVVFRMINIKDGLVSQIIRSLLYRKLVLWRDMNMTMDEYVHAQIKYIIDWIKFQNEKYNYIPSKPEFKEINFKMEGPFQILQTIQTTTQNQNQTYQYGQNKKNLNQEEPSTAKLTVMLKIFTENFDEMIDNLRDYAKLNEEADRFVDVNQNQVIVRSLRGKIETLTKNNEALQEKYYEIQSNIRTQDANEVKKLKDNIEELQMIVARKEREIEELKKNTQGSLSQLQNLRDKLKETEEELKQVNKVFLPKLKELEAIQYTLQDEFQKVKKDIDTYSILFKTESQMRSKVQLEKKEIEAQVAKLVDMLGREKNKVKDLKGVIHQKEEIIMEVMDYRSELLNQIKELQTQKQNIQIENLQLEEHITEIKQELSNKKYDEMFEINTHLNKRINELEDHKKKLLDLLKKHKINPESTLFNVEQLK